MFVYGLLRFDHFIPGGDHHRIIPSHRIATTGLGHPLMASRCIVLSLSRSSQSIGWIYQAETK